MMLGSGMDIVMTQQITWYAIMMVETAVDLTSIHNTALSANAWMAIMEQRQQLLDMVIINRVTYLNDLDINIMQTK